MDVVEQALEGPGTLGRDAKFMKMAVVQHVPFEGPAAIADWARERDVSLATFHVYGSDLLPELDAFDMLTVMGGPMSANDEAQYAWLAPEIALVREAVDANKIVVGICLGAQIIAKAMDAKVYVGPQKEIGWFPVRRTIDHPLFSGLPAEFAAFHWHGETFELPAGAVRLAETAVTANQAFAIGDRVLGLQFHLEATEDSVNALLSNASDEIADGTYEQSPNAILSGLSQCSLVKGYLDILLDNLTGCIGPGK
jgi:GMP synthase (glutamine-hydrolysing)